MTHDAKKRSPLHNNGHVSTLVQRGCWSHESDNGSGVIVLHLSWMTICLAQIHIQWTYQNHIQDLGDFSAARNCHLHRRWSPMLNSVIKCFRSTTWTSGVACQTDFCCTARCPGSTSWAQPACAPWCKLVKLTRRGLCCPANDHAATSSNVCPKRRRRRRM